LTASKAVVL
jgi:hypothetical protein